MRKNDKFLFKIVLLKFLLISYSSSFGQAELEDRIEEYAESISGKVGVHAMLLESEETVSYNADQSFLCKVCISSRLLWQYYPRWIKGHWT